MAPIPVAAGYRIIVVDAILIIVNAICPAADTPRPGTAAMSLRGMQ
jgi:hypothetical protein